MLININNTTLDVLSCNECDTIKNKYLIILTSSIDIDSIKQLIKDENIITFSNAISTENLMITYQKLKFKQIIEFNTGEIKLIFTRLENNN